MNNCSNELPISLSNRFPPKETGAVAVVMALSLVGLVGFMGLALDLGKLFVAKSELQNSADACALAAARELTGANDKQLVLAEAAGILAGSMHSPRREDWGRHTGGIINKVTFSNELTGSYQDAFEDQSAKNMHYARCEASSPPFLNWFIQVLNLLPSVNIGDQTVAASAVASLVPGQTTCPLPVAVCEDKLLPKKPGDWIGSLLDDGKTGDFLYAPFPEDQDNGARDIKDILTGNGVCNTPIDTAKVIKLGDPGKKKGADHAWNTRFGLYQGGYDANTAKPDLTGFAYTAKSWPSCEKAFTSGNFSQHRTANTPYQDDKKNKSINTGLKIPVDPSSTVIHSQGLDRRLAIVPVVNCPELNDGHAATVQKWACVLMLHPRDSSAKPEDEAFICKDKPDLDNSTTFLEFVGYASDSPCASIGIAGGPSTAAPLVPALVR